MNDQYKTIVETDHIIAINQTDSEDKVLWFGENTYYITIGFKGSAVHMRYDDKQTRNVDKVTLKNCWIDPDDHNH